MTSIHTNMAAISALRMMRDTDARLQSAQTQLSSGLRVSSAADDAAYWSISTTMRSETKALSAVADSIGLAQAIVDVAYEGASAAHDALVEVRNLLVLAKGMAAPSERNFEDLSANSVREDSKFRLTTLGKIESQINEILTGATDTVRSAGFSGTNLLHNSDRTLALADVRHGFVVNYFDGNVGTLEIDPSKTTLFSDSWVTTGDEGLLDNSESIDLAGTLATHNVDLFNTSFGSDLYYYADELANPSVLTRMEKAIVRHGADRAGTYDNAIRLYDDRIGKVADTMAYLGTVGSSLDVHEELVAKRTDSYERGIGGIVDADMGETSARLRALEAQKQLGVRALQIANSQPESILQLFA